MTLRALTRRVRYWQRTLDELGLTGWDLKVKIVEQPDGEEDSDACVTPSSVYDTAWLEFRRDRLDELEADGRSLDKTIVHELLHIVFRDYDAVVENATRNMGMSERFAWDAMRRHEMEGVIERLARTIVAQSGR